MKIDNPLTVCLLITLFLTFLAGCQSADPKERVTGAFQKLEKVDSFYKSKDFFSSKDMASAEKDKGEFYFSRPDKYWIKFEKKDIEYMAIGDKVYSRSSITGTWSDASDTGVPVVRNLINLYILKKEDLNKLSDFKYIENTELNGKKAEVYTYKSLDEKPSVGKIWISTEIGLPLRIDTGETSPGEWGSTVFDYEKKVNFKPPITE